MTRAHLCGIVPPYVLQALAVSGDRDLEEHARRTLAHDEALRAGRGETRSAVPTGTRTKRRQRAAAEAVLRSIHDAAHRTTLPGQQVRSEGADPSGDPSADRAYDGLGATWDLWHAAYGRNSLDDKGLALVASVHYRTGYDNAFWNGEQMVFGDGDGVVFLDFTSSVDVIGHELAHGVTQFTSGLNYQDQSGALNEHVSDVFGVLVNQRSLGQDATEADWLVGAQLLGPTVNGRALRDMLHPGTAYDDPRLGKDPQPATMSGYVDTAEDNGGVHLNSGIPNRAFALYAVALGGKAWERAGQVWVDTITGDIKADCDFATFAQLTLTAARERYAQDAVEVTALADAWDQVGVVPAAPKTRARRSSASREPAPTPEDQPASQVPAGTRVRVRRTGGFAGLEQERTVVLRDLPTADAESWRSLLAGSELHEAAAVAEERMHPDAFCYSVRWGRPATEVHLTEPGLAPDVRSLLERTLDQGQG